MRENYAREQSRTTAFEQKRDLFGADLFAPCAANVAVRANPRVDAILRCVAIRFDHDGATGVVLSNFRHKLCVLVQ